MSKYSTIGYLPKGIITVPKIETLNTLWLGTLDPLGYLGPNTELEL